MGRSTLARAFLVSHVGAKLFYSLVSHFSDI